MVGLLRRDVRMAGRYLAQWYGRWTSLSCCGLAVALLLVALCRAADEPVLQAVRASNGQTSLWSIVARELSYGGDFLGLSVMGFMTLWVAGRGLRSRRVMRVAVASLLCASLAGLTANVSRVLTGRPRPCTGLADRLAGPSLDGGRHALPSAHTATAFGTALPVLTCLPVVGVPLTMVASGVAWSRIQLERHRLTDVLAAACLALFYSVPLSRWALQRRTVTAHLASLKPSLDADLYAPSH